MEKVGICSGSRKNKLIGLNVEHVEIMRDNLGKAD